MFWIGSEKQISVLQFIWLLDVDLWQVVAIYI